jgi:hypothetical protein
VPQVVVYVSWRRCGAELDPFIDYIADKIARTVPEASPGPETGKTGTEP